MSWAHMMPSKIKLLAWNSLIRSKFTYGLWCIARINKRIIPTVKQFFYNSLKNLLQLKSRPKADVLFKLTLGIDIAEYIDLHIHKQAV